jgi:aquaporin Z
MAVGRSHRYREVAVLTPRITAEFVGTFCLVFFAVGSAVVGLEAVGAVGVALTFGLVLLALAYAIGRVSGCHVNPAVTLGVLLTQGISGRAAGGYVVAQVAGAVLAGAVLRLLVSVGGVWDNTDGLCANGWGETVNVGGAFLVEVLLIFLLVFVVLQVTSRDAAPGFAGMAIGLVLMAVHLVGIPLTGTSVNPARSLGPALFAGAEALSHVWLFIVAPLVGAVLAVAVTRALAARRRAPGSASDGRAHVFGTTRRSSAATASPRATDT